MSDGWGFELRYPIQMIKGIQPTVRTFLAMLVLGG